MDMQSGRSLVFVYNARSEALPKIEGSMSRVADSGGERCNLLALTFSPIGMKKEWKRFLHDLGMPARFLSRDEFASDFRTVTTTFPAAFLQTGKDLFILASTEEINRCVQLNDLITLVRQRISPT